MAPSARPCRVRSVAQRLPRATLAGSAGARARAPLAGPIRHIFAAISRGEPPAIGEEGHWDYSMERAGAHRFPVARARSEGEPKFETAFITTHAPSLLKGRMRHARLRRYTILIGAAFFVRALAPSGSRGTVQPHFAAFATAGAEEQAGEIAIEPIVGRSAAYDVTGWPTASRRLNDPFGPRLLASDGDRYDFHRAIDIAPLTDGGKDLVTALADGSVFRIYRPGDAANPYESNTVVLRHIADADIPIPGGGLLNGSNTTRVYYSLYLHLSQIDVVQGDPIALGAVLGRMGSPPSGYVHLHFETRIGTTCSIESSCSKGYDPHVNPFLFLEHVNRQSLQASVTSSRGAPLRVHLSSAADELGFNRILVRSGPVVEVFDMNERHGMDPLHIDDDAYASIRKARSSSSTAPIATPTSCSSSASTASCPMWPIESSSSAACSSRNS